MHEHPGKNSGDFFPLTRAYRMRATIRRSPRRDKKWRADVVDATGAKRSVDFGARGASDYTVHGSPHRMARYLRRHGAAKVDLEKTRRMSPAAVHRAMRKVATSTKEDWKDPTTPGYWSRWLLWSEPTLQDAARTIQKRDRIAVELRKD